MLLGDGRGGFIPQSAVFIGNAPSSLAVGDFNGDQIVDLAVANANSSSVSVLLGDGLGSFPVQIPIFIGTPSNSVAIGDANGNYGPPYIGWLITTCRSSDHGYRDRSAEDHELCRPSAA